MLTIGVLSYKAPDVLMACLSSIFKYTKDVVFEVIVIDNASDGIVPQLISHKFPNASIIANKENLFFSAYNIAFENSNGKYFLTLNQDIEFIDDSIKYLVDFMESHPDAGAAAPKSLNEKDKIYRPAYSFFSLLLDVTFLKFLRIFSPKKLIVAENSPVNELQVDIAQDSCLLLRREAFAQDRLYDDNLKLYWTEDDLCMRLHAKGWKVYYTETARVNHIVSYSTKKDGSRIIDDIGIADMFYYSEKYFGKIRTNLILKPAYHVTKWMKKMIKGC